MSEQFHFKPWDDFAHLGGVIQPIPIDGPPCTRCKHWQPETTRYRDEIADEYRFDGVRLCHKTNQRHDFSCFEAGIAPGRVGGAQCGGCGLVLPSRANARKTRRDRIWCSVSCRDRAWRRKRKNKRMSAND